MQRLAARSATDENRADTRGRSKSNSTVIHHFVQNFELSGFGSPGEALVQTVKELVDNAFDACRLRSAEQDAPTIRVVLRRLPALQRSNEGDRVNDDNKAEDTLELQVADNGAGLVDTTKALILFSSTKSGYGLTKGSSTGANAGKYGLGLTLSLLYSQKLFGGYLKLTAATLDSTEWSFTKCSIDLETGQPCILYRKTGSKPDSWALGCGTDMRLLVPGCEEAQGYAEPRLRALFARMHLSPDRAAGVTLACEGCLDNMTISVPRGGRECSPRLLIDNQDLVRAFATGLTAMIKVSDDDGALYAPAHEGSTSASTGNQASRTSDGESQRLLHVHSGSDGDLTTARARVVNENASLRGFPGEDIAVFECQGKHGTRVTASVALERPVNSRMYGEDVFNQGPRNDTTVPLLVHRFVNGVPMLDTNTSSACALVAGVSKAGWRSLGLKISASRVLHSEGRLRFVLSEAPTPLKVNGGEAWSALEDIKAVHVSVAASAETVPYTSLRKDAIAHKEGYVLATASAVKEGLLSLSHREIGGFRSAAEAAKDMIQEDLIPLMASSIASMVERSGEVLFQKNCLNALGVGAEYVQQERLSELLRYELRENIREEEERRATARARAAARKAEEAENNRGEGKEETKINILS